MHAVRVANDDITMCSAAVISQLPTLWVLKVWGEKARGWRDRGAAQSRRDGRGKHAHVCAGEPEEAE